MLREIRKSTTSGEAQPLMAEATPHSSPEFTSTPSLRSFLGRPKEREMTFTAFAINSRHLLRLKSLDPVRDCGSGKGRYHGLWRLNRMARSPKNKKNQEMHR